MKRRYAIVNMQEQLEKLKEGFTRTSSEQLRGFIGKLEGAYDYPDPKKMKIVKSFDNAHWFLTQIATGIEFRVSYKTEYEWKKIKDFKIKIGDKQINGTSEAIDTLGPKDKQLLLRSIIELLISFDECRRYDELRKKNNAVNFYKCASQVAAEGYVPGISLGFTDILEKVKKLNLQDFVDLDYGLRMHVTEFKYTRGPAYIISVKGSTPKGDLAITIWEENNGKDSTARKVRLTLPDGGKTIEDVDTAKAVILFTAKVCKALDNALLQKQNKTVTSPTHGTI